MKNPNIQSDDFQIIHNHHKLKAFITAAVHGILLSASLSVPLRSRLPLHWTFGYWTKCSQSYQSPHQSLNIPLWRTTAQEHLACIMRWIVIAVASSSPSMWWTPGSSGRLAMLWGTSLQRVLLSASLFPRSSAEALPEGNRCREGVSDPAWESVCIAFDCHR